MPASSQGFNLTDAADWAALVAALSVLAAIYKGIQAWLGRTLLSRQDLRRRLNRMACGVTSDYVTSLFGPPVFQRDVSTAGVQLRERIHRTRHAWLQAILFKDDSVALFSITITDRRFSYRITPAPV